MTVAIPAVKPVVTGYGMNSISRPSRTIAHRDEDDSGHQARREQAVEAVLGDDRGEDDHERRGWPRDLELRPAEERHDEPGDDRRIEPMLRGTPTAMASAIESGSATMPTTTAGHRVGGSDASVYPLANDRRSATAS